MCNVFSFYFFAFLLLIDGAKLRRFLHIHNTFDVSFYIPNVWYSSFLQALPAVSHQPLVPSYRKKGSRPILGSFPLQERNPTAPPVALTLR